MNISASFNLTKRVEKNSVDTCDVWKDPKMLCYLITGEFPKDCPKSEKDRISKKGKRYCMEDNHVFFIGVKGKRQVPPPVERIPLIKQLHEALGHRRERTMMYELRKKYFLA